MNDFGALTTWVQPRHLSASGIEGYQADFASRPVRVLQITDFLKADMVARIARFLGREATYEQVYTLYGTDENGQKVSADDWRVADEESRWYTHGMLSDPDPRFRLSPNLFTFLAFRKALATSAFKAYVSAVTGLPLGYVEGGTVHRMRPGDIIKPHSDRIRGRCLTFIFYLSPTWESDYGGALHIIGKNNERAKIEVTFNSFAMFDLTTQESHYVTDIRSTAGNHSRLAVAGWFRSPEHQ